MGFGVAAFAVPMALNDSNPSSFSDPQSWVQGILAIVLLILGGLVFWDLGPWSRSAGEVVVAEDPPAASLEDGLNEDLLKAARYTFNEEADWWERAAETEDAQFSETEVIIYDEDESWLVTASVFEVLSECAWVSGSAARFQYRNGAGCSLTTLLQHPKYQERLALSRHLVFLGMESYKNAPQRAGDTCPHLWLTECRADELAHKTRNMVPESWPVEIGFWTFDIGAHLIKSPKHEFDQRSAIVLGIRNRKSDMPVEDAISLIAARTPVREVRLKDYHKIGSAVAEKIEWVTGGETYEHK